MHFSCPMLDFALPVLGLASYLAASVFAVYLIHPLVAVSVASAFSIVVLYPLLKFVIVVLIVLPQLPGGLRAP
jgi:hypothetical protein